MAGLFRKNDLLMDSLHYIAIDPYFYSDILTVKILDYIDSFMYDDEKYSHLDSVGEYEQCLDKYFKSLSLIEAVEQVQAFFRGSILLENRNNIEFEDKNMDGMTEGLKKNLISGLSKWRK